ncbi:MAG: hypothetical protein ACYS8Z_24040, partial [Planctomycetota bacterium]
MSINGRVCKHVVVEKNNADRLQMAQIKQETVSKKAQRWQSASPILILCRISDSRIARSVSAENRFCRLLVLLVSAVLLSGCGEPERKVVAKWRGGFIEERQTDERTTLSPPQISAVVTDSEPGSFRLDTVQNELTTYSLEKRYEQVAVVRNLSPEQADRLRTDAVKSANIGVFIGGMWLVPPVGASVTAGAVALDKKKAESREQAQAEAIQTIKDGEPNVSVPLDFRWSTVKAEYRLETVGEEVDSAGVASEERMVAAAGIPLKIQNLQYPAQKARAGTDDSGRVSFSLARTLAEAVALKPGKWKISAKWEGKWQDVATVDVTPEWIEQTVRAFRQEQLLATGKSQLPPLASISFKVSNGALQAGTESDISLTVLNEGPGTFYRLVAVTESDIPTLNGLEFDFGKLAPGEGLSLLQRVRIPRRRP